MLFPTLPRREDYLVPGSRYHDNERFMQDRQQVISAHLRAVTQANERQQQGRCLAVTGEDGRTRLLG